MVPNTGAAELAPKAGVEPKPGLVVVPKAGVVDAPKAGVVVEPNAGVVEPKPAVPNAGAEVADVLPKRPVDG